MKKEAVLAFAFTIIASFYFSQILVEDAQGDYESASNQAVNVSNISE